MTLRVLDATGIVPEDYVGTFDGVNIRLLVPAVRGNDPRTILLNALRMLKPSGFLQWGEIIPRTITLGRPGHVSAGQQVMSAIMAKMGSPAQIEENWISRLPQIFEGSGLRDVGCLRTGEPRKHMWKCWGENCAGALAEYSMMARLGREALVEMAKERERGEFAFYEPQIVVGWNGE